MCYNTTFGVTLNSRKEANTINYAIIRNEKYKRSNLKGIYRHNERKNINYSNKNIDSEKTHLNYHIKQPSFSYEKEFERANSEYNLKGQIKEVSNIVCEYIITSSKDFFDNIGQAETKRYFETAHKFVSSYKNLGEQYILSSVVHLDEETPHMHLVFIPVVHTKDKKGHDIDKIACSEFWKAKDSYRQLQNAFFDYMTSNGFDLNRGVTSDREHIPVSTFKEVTGYNDIINTSITKATPIEVQDIKEISKLSLNRDKLINDNIISKLKTENEKLIDKNKYLYNNMKNLTNAVQFAEKLEIANKELYKENKILRKEFKRLKSENSSLSELVHSLQEKVSNLITWIAKKLSCSETNITEEFEKRNRPAMKRPKDEMEL